MSTIDALIHSRKRQVVVYEYNKREIHKLKNTL